MENETMIYLAAIIIMGFILLGLAGFMYDRLNKEIPSEDSDMSPRAAQRKLSSVFNAPFIYLHKSIKEKNFKGLIPSLIYIVIWIDTIILITHVTKIL